MEHKKSSSLFQKMFIYNYLKLRNVKEAALKAGSDKENAVLDGIELLKSKGVSKKINILNENLSDNEALIMAGLERLATGSINDAVALAFCDEMPSEKELSSLDLFNVSEIKRVKGGGVEIKFFDRQKALEKMWEIKNTTGINSSAESFLKALCADSPQETEGNTDTDDTV